MNHETMPTEPASTLDHATTDSDPALLPDRPSLFIRRRRLEAHIATLYTSLRSSRHPPDQSVLEHVNVAKRQLDRNCIDEGWHAVFAAHRAEIPDMRDDERQGRGRILLAEAKSGKLGPWRGEVVKDLVGDVGQTAPTEVALKLAMEVRDEALENDYRKFAYLRSHLGRIASVIVAALIAIFVVMRLDGSSPLRLTDAGNTAAIAYVLLFGVLGGAVSAMRPVGGKGTRLPELMETSTAGLARPLIGAASALAIVAFVQSSFLGIQLTEETRSAGTLALAFAAGFSERLVMRSLEEITKRVGGNKAGTGDGQGS